MDVSVVCPVYDAPAAWLLQAGQSVLDQQPPVRELILVDDASQQWETRDTCRRLQMADRRVLLRHLSRNRGPATARNIGLGLARGDWVGFLDADDLWLPGRLVVAEAVLKADPGAAWIGGPHDLLGAIPATAPSLPERLGQALPAAGDTLVLQGKALTRLFLADFTLHLGAMLVRRDLLARAGNFAEGLYYYEDFLMMAKLSVLAPLHYHAAPAYAWRREECGLTAAPARLSRRAARMHDIARADPLLKAFRRELRWASYSARKGLALNNLLAGHPFAALGHALNAYRVDPREWRELLLFLRLMAGRQGKAAREGARYSKAERFRLRNSGTGTAS